MGDVDMDQEQGMDTLMRNLKQQGDLRQGDWAGEQEKEAQKREEIKQECVPLKEQKTLEELKGQQQLDESDAPAADTCAADACATDVDGETRTPTHRTLKIGLL